MVAVIEATKEYRESQDIDIKERIDAVLKQLAGVFAGDKLRLEAAVDHQHLLTVNR